MKNKSVKSCALRTRDLPIRGHQLEVRKDSVANSLTEVQKDSLVVIIDPAFKGRLAADQKNSTALMTNWSNGNAWAAQKGSLEKQNKTEGRIMVERPKIDKVRVFSMFSGIGGFEVGIKKSLMESSELVGFCEIDKYAVQIFKENWKGVKNYGDATKIKTEELPDFGILVGGFPCQSFSLAGQRGGLQDTRGTLFYEIARILADKRPRHFLLENVKGLLSHDLGKTITTILRVFTDLDYVCQLEVCNSCDFGVPQNRERVFIIGHSGRDSFRQIFPLREGSTTIDGTDGADLDDDDISDQEADQRNEREDPSLYPDILKKNKTTAQSSSASPMEFG